MLQKYLLLTLIAEDKGTWVLQKLQGIIFLFNLLSSEFFDLDLTTEYTLKAVQKSIAMISILVIPIFFYKKEFFRILPTYRI